MRLPLMLTCQETTRLVLEGEDRALAPGERIRVRMHQHLCRGCARFSQQVRLMRHAMQDWRREAGDDDPGPPAR